MYHLIPTSKIPRGGEAAARQQFHSRRQQHALTILEEHTSPCGYFWLPHPTPHLRAAPLLAPPQHSFYTHIDSNITLPVFAPAGLAQLSRQSFRHLPRFRTEQTNVEDMSRHLPGNLGMRRNVTSCRDICQDILNHERKPRLRGADFEKRLSSRG